MYVCGMFAIVGIIDKVVSVYIGKVKEFLRLTADISELPVCAVTNSTLV